MLPYELKRFFSYFLIADESGLLYAILLWNKYKKFLSEDYDQDNENMA